MADTNSSLTQANQRGAVARYGYFADNGNQYIVYLTLPVATRGGFAAYNTAGGGIPQNGLKPKRLRMRYINMVRTNEDGIKEHHKNPVADKDATIYLVPVSPTNYDQEANWTVTSHRGESGKIGQRLPPAGP